MIEIYREEQVPPIGLAEEPVRFSEVEDEGLFDQEQESGLDHVEGGFEVVLVGKAERDEIGGLVVEHLVQVDIGRGHELECPSLRLLARPPDDRTQFDIGVRRQDTGVLTPPPVTRTDDGNTEPVPGCSQAPSSSVVPSGMSLYRCHQWGFRTAATLRHG